MSEEGGDLAQPRPEKSVSGGESLEDAHNLWQRSILVLHADPGESLLCSSLLFSRNRMSAGNMLLSPALSEPRTVTLQLQRNLGFTFKYSLRDFPVLLPCKIKRDNCLN